MFRTVFCSVLYCALYCIVFCNVLCSVLYGVLYCIVFCNVLCSVLYCVLYCIVLFCSVVYLVFLLYNAVAVSRVPFKAAGQAHLLTCYIFCNAAAFCCVPGVAASIVCLVSPQVLCVWCRSNYFVSGVAASIGCPVSQ